MHEGRLEAVNQANGVSSDVLFSVKTSRVSSEKYNKKKPTDHLTNQIKHTKLLTLSLLSICEEKKKEAQSTNELPTISLTSICEKKNTDVQSNNQSVNQPTKPSTQYYLQSHYFQSARRKKNPKKQRRWGGGGGGGGGSPRTTLVSDDFAW